MMLVTARQAGHTQGIGFGFPDEGMSCNGTFFNEGQRM